MGRRLFFRSWNWDVVDDSEYPNVHRYNARCSPIIPMIHQHICMHLTHEHDARIYFKKASQSEMNKLYAAAYDTYYGQNMEEDTDDENVRNGDGESYGESNGDSNFNTDLRFAARVSLDNLDDSLLMWDDDLVIDDWYDTDNGAAWSVSSDAMSSFYDYQWENEALWDEVDHSIFTNSGHELQRKCMHMWGQRLCLCQFLDWMDTEKFKCQQNMNPVPMSSLKKKVFCY